MSDNRDQGESQAPYDGEADSLASWREAVAELRRRWVEHFEGREDG